MGNRRRAALVYVLLNVWLREGNSFRKGQAVCTEIDADDSIRRAKQSATGKIFTVVCKNLTKS